MIRIFVAFICLVSFKISEAQISFEWATCGGAKGDDRATDISIDGAGNIYSTGFFRDTVDFDSGTGTYTLASSCPYSAAFVTKQDIAGNLIWAKVFTGAKEVSGISIATNTNGDVYITGMFNDVVDFDPGPGTYTLVGSFSVFVCKLNSNGNFIWAREMGGPLPTRIFPDQIEIDASENAYVVGRGTNGVSDFDPGPSTYTLSFKAGSDDAFIFKLDPSGNFLWAGSFNSISPGGSRIGGMSLDPSGTIYLAGDFDYKLDADIKGGVVLLTTAGGSDVFIEALNSSGGLLWVKQFGGPNNELVNDICLDGGGNIYTTGYFVGTCDFDPGLGTSYMTSSYLADTYISKLSPLGNFIWSKSLQATNSSSHSRGNSLSVDKFDNVYVGGEFDGTVDLDPSPAVTLYTCKGSYFSDIYIDQLSASGNYNYTIVFGGYNNDYPSQILVDAGNYIYTAGFYADTIDFDPTSSTFTLNSQASSLDFFIQKLGQSGVGINEVFRSDEISIYPNPTNSIINFKLKADREISIYNLLGEKVFSQFLKQGKNSIDVNYFTSGVYYLDAGENKTKIIKYD